MYQEKEYKKTRKSSHKSIALLVSFLLLFGTVIGGTIAFLVDIDDSLENVFSTSQVTTEVEETVSGMTKSDVSIKNTGDIEAWIRATVVVTWQDANGNVYGQAPKESDYEIVWSGITGGTWKKGPDGFYYHLEPVAPEKSTNVLFTECKVAENADIPDGYYLSVEILGSGIQSVPTSAVVEAWESGVSSVSGTTLQIKE